MKERRPVKQSDAEGEKKSTGNLETINHLKAREHPWTKVRVSAENWSVEEKKTETTTRNTERASCRYSGNPEGKSTLTGSAGGQKTQGIFRT